MAMSLDLVETGSVACCKPDCTDEIRVVSWNIARGSRFDEIAAFLAETHAHVICLQESDCNARRTRFRNVAAELAAELGANYAFGIEFEELAQGSRGSPAYHGQATLSLLPIEHSRVLRFRAQSRFWKPHWAIPRLAVFQRRLGGRIALVTHLKVWDKVLVVYNVHLESRDENCRQAQLAELWDDTRRYDSDVPVLVAGDFNFDLTEDPAASAIKSMEFRNPFEHLRVATTRPRFGHRDLTIDSILTKASLGTADEWVHGFVGASDHFPLSLRVRL